MPIALEPNEKRLFWLKSDEAKPEATRPAFVCAAPTRSKTREWRQLAAQARQLTVEVNVCAEKKDFIGSEAAAEKRTELFLQMALMGVVGWKNFGDHQFTSTAECLSDILSDGEIAELAWNWPDAFALSEDDRKNLSSLQPSDAEKSAVNAAAENATKNLPTTNPAPLT